MYGIGSGPIIAQLLGLSPSVDQQHGQPRRGRPVRRRRAGRRLPTAPHAEH